MDDESFARLGAQLRPLMGVIGQASDTIINERVSKYPIFAAHRQGVELGIPLVRHEETGHDWSVNASTLEEFATKGLIAMEKVKDFKKVYKPPADYVCLFVLEKLGATFVFLPRI